MRTDDTIAAISTPEGRGGIGIIRISGTEAFAIGGKIFKPISGNVFSSVLPRQAVLGRITDPENGTLVDEALALKFVSPRSYTRDDMVELHCHGGSTALGKALSLVFEAGARPAEPGEFTLRAFLNGRIDLSQAEAVMDVIESKTERALAAAVNQLEGGLSRRLDICAAKLLETVARIEASIEYPEYEETELTRETLLRLTGEASESLGELAAGFRRGRLLREGISVVIAGRPNSGKSSLMNELTGHERSIVTDIPGTTRDVVDEYVNINGLPARIVDTAGLRSGGDLIENIGMDRARAEIERSDIVLYLIDAAEGVTEEDELTMKSLGERNLLIVLNKSDLLDEAEKSDLVRKAAQIAGKAHLISVKTGEGTENLRDAIAETVTGGKIADTEEIMTNARHFELVRQALDSIGSAREAIENNLPHDISVIDLHDALDAIGRITGKTAGDEIVNEIFARFCLGK